MRRRHIIAGSLLVPLFCSPVMAQMAVIDGAALLKWVQQAQQMQQTVTQLESAVRSLTDVPQNLTQMVEGLLNTAVQNPLGQIEQNLQVLMTGQGTGNCGGSQVYLTQNQYAVGSGTDLTAQLLNQSVTRNAGLQACTQQMMMATQARLQQMPGLLNELQGATDITQVEAIRGRIEIEVATINAQQQQAILLNQTTMVQHMMDDDKRLQKQRADAQEIIQNTGPNAPAGNVPQVTNPPVFAAGGG
jgi:hypothetical protein